MFNKLKIYGKKLKIIAKIINIHAVHAAKFFPAIIGNVFAFIFLSPLISSIDFAISLPTLEEKDNKIKIKMGFISRYILFFLFICTSPCNNQF